MSTRRIGDADIEEARATSIFDIARRLGLGTPVRRGRQVTMLCPLHDDHDPSLQLNLDKNVWFCFVCGIGGDGIKLVMEAKGLGFQDAVRWIAQNR